MTAIIFDLYGTLIGNFSRQAYDSVLMQMAKLLGVSYPKFWQAMGGTIKDRSSGNLTAEESIAGVCRRAGVKADRSQIEQAVFLQDEFTRNSMTLEPEVLITLDLLKRKGLHIGLITNCNSAVPKFFPESPLAQYIDVPVFSCEEGITKPSHRIYEIACERLKVQPQECLYVGDGSDNELTTAAALGMLPILKRTDLTDVYDQDRPEVENWKDHTIDEIAELCDFVSRLMQKPAHR